MNNRVVIFGKKSERDMKVKTLAQKLEASCTEIYRHFVSKNTNFKTIVEYGCILSWMHLELNNLKRSGIFLEECEDHF